MGVFIKGIFVSSESKIKQLVSGGYKKEFIYLLAIGTNTYRIKSDNDYSGKLILGDECIFKVSVNAFNNSAYYRGDLVEKID